MLGNRLSKQLKHLRGWAKAGGITCFRLYERDIPEFPAIVDWYDGDVVAWVYNRTRDDTPEKVRAFEDLCEEEILDGLQVPGAPRKNGQDPEGSRPEDTETVPGGDRQENTAHRPARAPTMIVSQRVV